MTESIDWNAKIDLDPEEEYQSFLRTLRWVEGFGLMFVRCSPAEGTNLIDRIHKDLPQKKTATLTLGASDWNLYDIVNNLPNKDEIEILFIQGLENPIYDYEKNRLWDDSSDRYSYSLSGVPRLLSHLNMRRESFRDNFKICFVFLVPLFVLKYLIRRASDFFDWRSGVWEFDTDPEIVKRESVRILKENVYLAITPQERYQKILEIQSWLEEDYQTLDFKIELLLKQADFLAADYAFEAMITNYNKVLCYKPDSNLAWYDRGVTLTRLKRYDEAIASFDQALQCKPDDHEAWYNRGVILSNLERYDEAIISYDQALHYKSDMYEAWGNRGSTLRKLERYDEAIISYDQALKIYPKDRISRVGKRRAIAALNNPDRKSPTSAG